MSDAPAIAQTLIAAQRDRSPIATFTRRDPFLDVENAYRAQALVAQRRLHTGEVFIGHKLGLTSMVKRQALGIHQPIYGRLTSGMLLSFAEPVGAEYRVTAGHRQSRQSRSVGAVTRR